MPCNMHGLRRYSAVSASNLKLLQEVLDRQIVGHEDAKEAVLLGLVAGEHVYMEGPPGVGKTYLAETAAKAAGLSSFFYQFHRDTRVGELIGDSTIVREKLPEGEVIRQGVRPGGVLTADVCVLDDISRAPGEALNVLLQLLNERSFMGEELKLRCAIATGNPSSAEFVNEPLDPAVMDRFALQVDMAGLVKGAEWHDAARVMEQTLAGNLLHSRATRAMVERTAWAGYDESIQKVEISKELLSTLLAVLKALVVEYDLGSAHSALLTDRTFLVKTPRIMRARALLNGRSACTEEDLQVLRLMTRFRIPLHVHDQILDIITKVLQSRRSRPGPGPGADGSGDVERENAERENSETPSPSASPPPSQNLSESQSSPPPSSPSPTPSSSPELKLSSEVGLRWRNASRLIADPLRVEGVELLMRSLHGTLEPGLADRANSIGGSPRTWSALRNFGELRDADMAALSIWCDSPGPMLPRAVCRERMERGGALAIARDVSESMNRPNEEYLLARCASSIVQGIVHLARRTGMRVGYSEFGSSSKKFFTKQSGQQFFSQDYAGILELAANLVTKGATNYEQALHHVLEEFFCLAQAKGPLQRMHAVMISDGEFSVGRRRYETLRALAQQLGVCIHTVFIGDGRFPAALTQLATDSGGKRFHAVPDFEHRTVRIFEDAVEHDGNILNFPDDEKPAVYLF